MNILSKDRLNHLASQFTRIAPILVVGDVGIDKYTFGNVQRISPEAPVPVIEVQKEWEKLGLAANVSDNLASLKISSILFGVIGEDEQGEKLIGLLKNRGIKNAVLICDKSRTTTVKERVVTEAQQICRIDYETRNFLGKDVEQRLLEKVLSFRGRCSALILEDYGKGTLTKSLLHTLIREFGEHNIPIYIDPNKDTPPLYYKGVTLLKPNRQEAWAMAQALGYRSDNGNLQKISELLAHKLCVKNIVVTLGKDGMALYDRTRTPVFQMIPTMASEVFDVSGAGDTAIALLTASLQADSSLEEAAWLANCGSGIVVGKRGTATVTVSDLQIIHKKFLKAYTVFNR